MNINDFSRLYRQTVNEVSDGSSTVRLKLDRVGARVARTLSHVTVENETTSFTKCRLGIQAGKRDHYIDELETPDADELAVSRSDILLGEGDVFFAELTGTTDGDKIVMTCVGWELDL